MTVNQHDQGIAGHSQVEIISKRYIAIQEITRKEQEIGKADRKNDSLKYWLKIWIVPKKIYKDAHAKTTQCATKLHSKNMSADMCFVKIDGHG